MSVTFFFLKTSSGNTATAKSSGTKQKSSKSLSTSSARVFLHTTQNISEKSKYGGSFWSSRDILRCLHNFGGKLFLALFRVILLQHHSFNQKIIDFNAQISKI